MASARDVAKLAGLKKFNTGKPCVRGHMSDRHSSNGQCIECDRELKAAKYKADPKGKRAVNADYREKNKEKCRAHCSDWRKANPAKACYHTQKRRARKLNATPGWFGDLDELVMQEAHDLARLREEATGIKWEVDHIIPLGGRMVCGLHVAGNIQVIPMAHNRSKSNAYAVQ